MKILVTFTLALLAIWKHPMEDNRDRSHLLMFLALWAAIFTTNS